ncbi:hypothetical protein AAE02nite_40720 [Adhaeribacter aerolatus]|uniref:Uncharacterized protein n=1 Tax=Adhaeribacter aerolatus TaxID=670289 RepID=A0A512B369_9BACT|nr:hypothetical protein [Adhaeribacter aerolatus]GEO06408.1 hypothetical protein AAE02nite_40720 [Adhaeribacter aerolatus]
MIRLALKKLAAAIAFMGFLLPYISWGQETEGPNQEPDQSVRLELEEKSFEKNIHVFPLPDSTILVYKQPNFGSFKEKHSFQRYSKGLKLLWTSDLELEDQPDFHQFYASGNSIYLLYLENVPRKFFILKMNLKTGAHQKTNFNLKKQEDLDADIKLDHFQVLNGNYFISAHSSRNSLVIHINEATKDIKTIPALYDQENALEEFHMDTLANRAEFILSETNGIKGRLQVKRFTPAGNLYSNTLLQPPFGRNLVSAQLTPGDSLQKLVIGTYSHRDTRYAQGFFSSALTTPDSLRYIDFIQTKHFFDFLSKRAHRKVYQKAERFKSQDKDLRHRYRLLFHNLVQQDGVYYLFSEVFQPQGGSNNLYRWPGYYSRIYGFDRYFPYPNAYGRNTPDASEYRYSHAVLCAFDKNGKLLWDNSFVLKDVVRNNLGQTTYFAFTGEQIAMAYLHEEEIRYKVFTRDSTSANDLSVPLAGNNPQEKVTSVEDAGFVHWYGPHFLAFGFGRIKPPKSAAREVFFLNKVSF